MSDIANYGSDMPVGGSLQHLDHVSTFMLPKYLQDLQQRYSHELGLQQAQPSFGNLDDFEYITADGSRRLKLLQLLWHREWVTWKMTKHGRCYPPFLLERARIYEALEYTDLAAFDAFVVYTLCQKELSDEFVTDLVAYDEDGQIWSSNAKDIQRLKVSALPILVRCLTHMGATVDATRMRQEFQDEVNNCADTDQSDWPQAKVPAWTKLTHSDSSIEGIDKILDSSPRYHFGHSRREVYPWSTYEPDRNSPEAAIEINHYLSGISSNLEAKITALPAFDESGNASEDKSYQLGLFAITDLKPGEEVLREKSILTAIRPLEDAICDACGQELEEILFEDVRQCDGDDCDITFCSEECKQRAIKEYHKPSIEESVDDKEEEDDRNSDGGDATIEAAAEDSDEINDTQVNGGIIGRNHSQSETNSPASMDPFCGNTDLSTIGRPTNTTTPEWDLYFLLLTRTTAMSLTQNTHPLSLTEIKYLWGDFSPSPFSTTNPSFQDQPQKQTLPFSHIHNLQYTLDYFTTLSLSDPRATPYSAHWLHNFDFWILQTLLAKFRGVANATQSTFDGKPEIASVHPGWCLANHSCDPNVRWTPKGTRKFFVRNLEQRATYERPGREDGSRSEWEGIGAGEEIFSHYTDIRLSVQERRERLREVLGGNCRCQRCVAESQAE